MSTENLFTPDCIRTYTGLYMNVFEPTLDMVCIEDIAHSLSMQCRFGGHLPKFYSVAQHSILVALRISETGIKLEALLHDASEAYLMDIPSPIKKRLSNYKEIEENLMRIIGDKFGFTMPLHEKVKDADAYMLQWEWDNLMLRNHTHFLTQKQAEDLFMKRFNDYNL